MELEHAPLEAVYIYFDTASYDQIERDEKVILHRIYLSVRLDSLAAPRAWAVFLAKTSRTAVPTAIMPIIAGGRLYKCLYKMHVDSRAFWGAFWGAFRVFLSEPG